MEGWEIIDVYTPEDAVNDGYMVRLGTYENHPVYATLGVYEQFIEGKMSYEEFLSLRPVRLMLAFAYMQGWDIYPLKLQGVDVWLDWNGESFIFLLPSEY